MLRGAGATLALRAAGDAEEDEDDTDERERDRGTGGVAGREGAATLARRVSTPGAVGRGCVFGSGFSERERPRVFFSSSSGSFRLPTILTVFLVDIRRSTLNKGHTNPKILCTPTLHTFVLFVCDEFL